MSDPILDRAGRDLEERIADIEDLAVVLAALVECVRTGGPAWDMFQHHTAQENVRVFAGRIRDLLNAGGQS